jgi:hypothetical protein
MPSTLQTNRFSKNTLVGYCEVDLFEMLTKVTPIFVSLSGLFLIFFGEAHVIFSLVGCIPFS